MDYLGWELERQRAALAALLLGGGNNRDGESVPDEARRNSPGTPEPDAGSGQRAPEAWEAVRAARRDRENSGTRAGKTPVSAWKAILGGEAVWTARQDLEDGGSGSVETALSAWETILGEGTGFPVNSEEGARLRRSGGTGAQPELPRPSVGYTDRRGVRRTDLAAKLQRQAVEIRGDGAGDDAASPEAGENSTAGDTAAAGSSGQFRSIRRSGGNTAGTLDYDEPVAGTAPWGGGWGTAALRAEDSAKLLSRAVQRDARRYDGGFNIF